MNTQQIEQAAINGGNATVIGSFFVWTVEFLSGVNVVGFITALSAVAGLLVSIYFNWQRNKREAAAEKRAQALHEAKMQRYE